MVDYQRVNVLLISQFISNLRQSCQRVCHTKNNGDLRSSWQEEAWSTFISPINLSLSSLFLSLLGFTLIFRVNCTEFERNIRVTWSKISSLNFALVFAFEQHSSQFFRTKITNRRLTMYFETLNWGGSGDCLASVSLSPLQRYIWTWFWYTAQPAHQRQTQFWTQIKLVLQNMKISMSSFVMQGKVKSTWENKPLFGKLEMWSFCLGLVIPETV